MTHLLILMTTLGLVACDSMGQRIYENMRSIRDSRRSPAERTVAPSPSYDEYKKEREGKPKE
jgi:hypothetical protein